MKTLTALTLKMITTLIIALQITTASAQNCTPAGNQTTYGTNNTWIGYVYRGMNFNVYKGYVTEGSAASPDFDESFGGDNAQYATHGCTTYSDTFSVRYKLTKTFTAGNYTFTLGGDDGYRFSIDGGATWAINNWADHSYTTSTATIALNGTYNLVFEYYEHFINNRVTFKVVAPCLSNTSTAAYGASTWIGYVFEGMNFDFYKGTIGEGTQLNPNFDENFGGDNVTLSTTGCSINTNNFSVRYRMQKTLASGTYVITVGGDDGYRLSLDGGATWVINKWVDQSYAISSYTAKLNGTYNMVLEYYENSGGNRISFNMSASTLPVKLLGFSGKIVNNDAAALIWKCAEATNFSHFIVQKSNDGRNFQDVRTVAGLENEIAAHQYEYTDTKGNSGTEYFRIAMVDKDGTTIYSGVIILNFSVTTSARVYPTLINSGTLTVETNVAAPHAKLEIFDMNGRNVFSKELAPQAGAQQVTLSSAIMNARGSYVARVSGTDQALLSQMIVVR